MLLLSLVIFAVVWYVVRRIRGVKGLRLPPGPSKLPFLGNFFDMPTGRRWETFAKWGEQWGEISSISIFGTHFVMLNSLKAATELLDKRGRIYSDRPEIPMAGSLVGWKSIVSFLRYGDHFKQCRKYIHGFVGTSVSLTKYHHIHEQEAHKLLKRVLTEPENLEDIVNHTSGVILIRSVYGVTGESLQSHFVRTADKAVHDLYDAINSGFLVDALPILRHVPRWFPGAQFQRHAYEWSKTFNQMADEPFAWIKKQLLVEEANAPSFVGEFLHKGSADEFTIKWTAASMSAAGPDTTAWTIYAFFKAMVLFPKVMARAQAEIDAVVGPDRFPLLSDRESLPYIDAMVQECLRWHPVAPLGFPRILTEDDTYEGYSLPKGTIVQANVWKISQDPSIYPNPTEFNPTRFIAGETKQTQPTPDYTLGWGRRICPGRLMAQEAIFTTIARTLAVFNIDKAMKNGVPVAVDMGRDEGVVSRPTKFDCVIRPRSERALALVNDPVS